MKTSEKIILLLEADASYSLSQILGYPFEDFRISHVGETFESLISEKSNKVLPSFDELYGTFISKWGSQFENQNVGPVEIKGRVARMWASLVREWYAYFRIKEEIETRNIEAKVERNDRLDTEEGIDVYIKSEKNASNSLKIDILQETKRAQEFRSVKDRLRIKGEGIPGVRMRIFVGKNSPGTRLVRGLDGQDWFLISDSQIESLITEFTKINY